MAPYRNSRSGNRSTRTQIDQEVFEGLPVRHWRKAPIVVHAAPPKDTSNAVNARTKAWPELPMPRDSHLYSPMSQALLRAARMGRINKPAAPPLEEEKEPGEDDDADGDLDAGFSVRRWTLVPKHLEGPEPEFLAKRRKGLPSFYTGTMGPAGAISGQMRKTKIKKIDSEGNVSIWDVLVPEGQIVEGEIVEEEPLMTEAPAPGTVVEGVGVVNSEGVVIAGDQMLSTPPRRRPPPPKRKGKGIAKGKRKRVGFVSISKGGPPPKRPNGHLAVSSISSSSGGYAMKPVNVTDVAMTEAVGNDTGGGDTPMQDGEEGGEEGSEDDEDGEEGEENDREEGEVSPSPSFSKSPSKTPAANTLVPYGDQNQDIPALILSPPRAVSAAALPPPDRDMSSSPDLPLAAATHHQQQQQQQQQQQHQPQSQQQIFPHAPLIRIEPAQESVFSVPAPETIAEIPEPQQLSIAEPPPPDPASANAQLPMDHDLLDGLAAPVIPSPLSAPQAQPEPQLQPQNLEQEQQEQQEQRAPRQQQQQQPQPQEEAEQQQAQVQAQAQQQQQEHQEPQAQAQAQHYQHQHQQEHQQEHQEHHQHQEPQQHHQHQHEQHEQQEQRPPGPEPEPEPEPEVEIQPQVEQEQEQEQKAHNDNNNDNDNDANSTIQFPDGEEEDLLGSLERSLARRGGGEAATTTTTTPTAIMTASTTTTTTTTTATIG